MVTDWLMVAITAIYVAATILICIFNGKSAKAAREQILVAKAQHEGTQVPVLAVYPFINRDELFLEIKNIGARKALQVELDFPESNTLPGLKRNLAVFEEKLKGQEIELMPQQSVYYDLGHSVVETETLCAQQMQILYVTISCCGENGMVFHSRQMVDLSIHGEMRLR